MSGGIMKKGFLLIMLCAAFFTTGYPRESDSAKIAGAKYLFTYFKGNGEDGLHLAVSNDGLKWDALNNDSSLLAPAVGGDRLMRDPCVIYGADNKYRLTWTVSWKEPGIGYAESEDLLRWSGQKLIPVMENESGAINCWAPELFYDDVENRYILFWASTIPGKFPETDGQDKSKKNAGYNHRIYCATTKDFKTFSPTRLFYDQGFNVIDATIVKEGKRYIMFLKDETNAPFTPQKNIRMAIGEKASGPYGKPSEPITGGYWAEGPAAVKINGIWHVYFDKYMEHKYGLIISEDLKTWRDISDKLVLPDGIRHGTVIEIHHAR